ncbi:MAG: hypothetical protein RBS39_07470 [Phycisphaerales bacterium]|jgi:hypothetical protein|nr:hypothetical protein [Phycisphaerales bacterium]
MRRRNVVVLLVSAPIALVAGCSSNSTSASAIRSNPTPELRTVAERNPEVKNNVAITNNTNSRSLRADLGRAFLFDRPSRLGPYPYTR